MAAPVRERGGAFVAQRPDAAAAAVPPTRSARRVRAWQSFAANRVTWTLPLAGLLLYTVVFTSVRAPFGDLAIGLALLGMLLYPKAFRLPSPLASLAVFLVWVFVTSIQTEYPDWFGDRMLDLVKLWLIALVAYNALRTRGQIRLFMIFYLACFALWPVRGTLITYFVYREFDNEGRAAWIQLYSNPNDLANMALLQLSMAAALLATERTRWVRLCATAGVLLLPLVILLTQSRGVFLGLIAFIAIVFTGQRRKVQLAVRLFALVVILIAVTPSGVWDRLESLRRATSRDELAQVDGSQGSALQRYEIWRVASRIISDHPMAGVGFNAYKPAHFKYSADPAFDQNIHDYWDTHSLYLNVIAETGFPGLLLYLAYFAAVLIPVERTRRDLKSRMPDAARQLLTLEAGLVGFMLACVFGSLAYLPHLHLHLALLYVLAAAYRSELGGGALQATPSRLPRRMVMATPRARVGA